MSERRHLPVVNAAWADELERQLDRSALRGHAAGTLLTAELAELTARMRAAVELLVARGVLTRAEVDATFARLRKKMGSGEQQWSLYLNLDPRSKYETPVADVDCAARVHLCRAVCCSLEVPLQQDDVEEGVVAWDHARPYKLRTTREGTCVHLEGGRCGVFEARPRICRLYTCRDDERVWKDFDKMIPNREVIDQLFEQVAEENGGR